jgi:hypothetical protein
VTHTSITADGGGELGLPPLFTIRDFDGSLSEWLDRAYLQYRAMVHDAGIVIWDKRVIAFDEQAEDGRDATFWHCITDGKGKFTANGRKLNPMRVAVLGRAWDLLERLAAGDPRAVWWREGHRILVCPVDWSLIVVLMERRQYFALLTSHCVYGRKVRNRLQNRAAKSWLSGESRREHAKPRGCAFDRGETLPAVTPRHMN